MERLTEMEQSGVLVNFAFAAEPAQLVILGKFHVDFSQNRFGLQTTEQLVNRFWTVHS